jgi:hypothetical protein
MKDWKGKQCCWADLFVILHNRVEKTLNAKEGLPFFLVRLF